MPVIPLQTETRFIRDQCPMLFDIQVGCHASSVLSGEQCLCYIPVDVTVLHAMGCVGFEWTYNQPSSPGGNWLGMPRAVEKGSRIVNWRIHRCVRSYVKPVSITSSLART
ncbi:hypothetical protein TNCV_3358281 [Trichonephila clavipes]|nr:hypothetical protein TNCV_3358281 [Trichonephila clavipes]